MLEVRLGMKNADGKKYDENCEKFELGSFSYRGPNSSETMIIFCQKSSINCSFFVMQPEIILLITQKKSKKHVKTWMKRMKQSSLYVRCFI